MFNPNIDSYTFLRCDLASDVFLPVLVTVTDDTFSCVLSLRNVVVVSEMLCTCPLSDNVDCIPTFFAFKSTINVAAKEFINNLVLHYYRKILVCLYNKARSNNGLTFESNRAFNLNR